MRLNCPQIWKEAGGMAHRCALMGVQAAGRETLTDPSPVRPSPQDARRSTPAAAGMQHRIGAAQSPCSCLSGSCTCITHTCPHPPALPSRAVRRKCAPCSASTRTRAAGTTSGTGRRGLEAGEGTVTRRRSLGGQSLTQGAGCTGANPAKGVGWVGPMWRGAWPKLGWDPQGLEPGSDGVRPKTEKCCELGRS